MKYICNECHEEPPCILEVSDDSERPTTCPWRGDLFFFAKWEELKESDYFEMRGFGKTQVEGKKMKDETEKERVARRLKNIIHNTGRIEVKSCETCGRCEKTGQANNPHRGKILMQALDIINGERQDQYGKPEDSFALIGKYWTEFLRANGIVHADDTQISPKEVAEMMMLFKIARMSGQKPSRDNYLDLVGYAGIAADMVEGV